MFLKFVMCFHSIIFIVEGVTNTTTKFITKQHLSVGAVLEISIDNIQIAEEMKPPLMMMSIMIDKTLGYDIDPFFPYYVNKVPVLDLNAAANNQNFILSPTTFAYEIDFGTKTLNPFTSSLLVHMYPNISSIVRNETEEIIKMTSSQYDGNIFYNLSFVIFIASTESEGLYKIHMHSSDVVPMWIRTSGEWQTLSSLIIMYSLMIGVGIFVILLILCRWRENDDFFVCWCLTTNQINFIAFEAFKIVWCFGWIDFDHNSDLQICSVIIQFFMTCYEIIVLCNHIDIWNTLCKDEKVFFVSAWLLLFFTHIHGTIHAYSSVLQQLKLTMNLMFLTISTMLILKGTVIKEYVDGDCCGGNNKSTNDINYGTIRDRLERCPHVLPHIIIHIIFALFVSFDFILVAMISFGLPFHLHWIQIVIEELLNCLFFGSMYLVLCEVFADFKKLEKQNELKNNKNGSYNNNDQEP